MKINRLMSAAEAAGYAMAVPEEFMDDAPARTEHAPEAKSAETGQWQDESTSANWVREWVAGFRTGRATA